MWTHSAHTETWVSASKPADLVRQKNVWVQNKHVQTQLWCCWGEAWWEKKQKSKPLLSSSVSKTERTRLEKLCTTFKESLLIDKPSARSFFWWTSCRSRSSWFLLASKNFSTGPDTRRPSYLKRTRRCSFSKLVAAILLLCTDDDNKQVNLKNKPKIGNFTKKQAQHALSGKSS